MWDEQYADDYLTDDEMEYLTDDEGDLAAELAQMGIDDRPAIPSSSTAHPLGPPAVVQPANDDNFDDFMDYDDLEQVDAKEVEGFPERFRFLLALNAISERVLRDYPVYNLIACNQTTVHMIIEKEIAMVCLLWAQSFIDCRTPIVEDAPLTFVGYKAYRPEGAQQGGKSMCRVMFRIPIPRHDRQESKRTQPPKKGMVVVIKGPNEWKESASIQQANEHELIVCLRCRVSKLPAYDRIVNMPITLFEVPSEFVPLAMLNSIQGMQSGALDHFIIPNPEFRETPDEYMARRNAHKETWLMRYIPVNTLTNDQQDAVFAICNKEHGNLPFLVHGPPGTGKTCTISAAIKVLLQLSAANRILVCTPSNMAADRVAERLISEFGTVLNETNVLRLKSTGNDYANRDRQFDCITSRDTSFEQFTIPKNYEQFRVVVCTLGCSSHLMRVGVERGFFSHIIVDEAGQCSEAEIWIPIGGLALPETSIILCGDHHQLGPVITLDFSPNLTKRFQSPLCRYQEMRPYKRDPRMCTLLSECFRCPRPLVVLASTLFYDGKLKYAGDHDAEGLDFSAFGPPKEFPLLFVSVDSCEEPQPKGFSFANSAEAEIILMYTSSILQHTDIKPEDIGIISPYRYQNRVICERMRDHPMADRFKRVTVDTVERFQGSERACILMSTVRTNDLGFVRDDLRVNTSITRAQHLLIVVGNEQALCQHTSWRVFINFCKKYGGYKKWKESSSVR